MGKTLLMGRRTHESIGRPLPGRTNIVITRQQNYQSRGCIVAHSLKEAMVAAGNMEELVVIGGAMLYAETLPQASRIYLTRVRAEVEGDAWFPELEAGQWKEVWRADHPADARHAYRCSFSRLERKIS
jgi:dihydrofolate reductase